MGQSGDQIEGINGTALQQSGHRNGMERSMDRVGESLNREDPSLNSSVRMGEIRHHDRQLSPSRSREVKRGRWSLSGDGHRGQEGNTGHVNSRRDADGQ